MKQFTLLVAMLIAGVAYGQIFSDQVLNLDPEMREYTSTGYRHTQIVRYGDGNALHCSQRTLPDGTHQFECTRMENGVIRPAEVVFRNYTPFFFEARSDVQAHVSVTPNGDAVAAAPRADRQGVRLAFQRRNADGSFGPWVESPTMVNTLPLHGVWVSVQDSLERIQILTINHARDQNPNDSFTPYIRLAEIAFLQSTPIVIINGLKNVGQLGLNVSQWSTPTQEIVIFNDAARRKVIYALPDSQFTAILVCTYDGDCFWRSAIDFGFPGSGLGEVLRPGSIAHDFDPVSGRLFFLISKGYHPASNPTLFATAHPSPVPDFRQYYTYAVVTREIASPPSFGLWEGAGPLAVKALGDDRVAIAWATGESLRWQIYFPFHGWSPVMGGIPFWPLFPVLDSSARSVSRDLVDIGVAPHTGEIVLAAHGVAPDRFGRALYAQAYDPKTHRHGSAQLISRLSAGYGPLYNVISSRGLYSSYSLRQNPLMQEPLSSKNQQITLSYDWLRAGDPQAGNHGLAWNANRQLVWTRTNAIVEEAPDLAGPWTQRTDWASPQKVPSGSDARFFRLKLDGR